MYSILKALPLLALAVEASPVSNFQRCGNDIVPESVQAAAQYFAQQDRLNSFDVQASDDRSIVIDTYFHVISKDGTEQTGNLSDEKVQLQFDALNRDFNGTGISFTLKETTRTVSKDWASFDMYSEFAADKEYEMKKALRKGSYAALNVYYRPLGSSLLGVCVFPSKVTPGDRTFYLDGCQVHTDSVPGGSLGDYNEGKTATHEIGHWLGLFHTFQGGCSGTGDGVDDTPAQRSSTYGCPDPNPDTCAGDKYPGVDPIHNFMDYSFDPCMYEFTPGQQKRVFDFWDTYRASYAGLPGPSEEQPPTPEPEQPPAML
ncbi:Ulilysin [Dactylellina cionopaga]|nr:Ulilysin [Dactylellina cionopaga]